MRAELDAWQASPAGGLSPAAEIFWRAVCRVGQGDFRGGLADTEDYAQRFPGEFAGPVARLRAACRAAAGEWEAALPLHAAAEAAGGAPEEVAANLLDWGRALQNLRRFSDAAAMFARAGDVAAAPPTLREEARLLQGRALVAAGEGAAALAALRPLATNALVNAALRAAAWFAVSDAWAGVTNRPAALEAVSNGLALASAPREKAEGLARAGRLLVAAGRVDDGTAAFRAAVAADPDSPVAGPAQMALAEALLDAGLHGRAALEFERYLEAFDEEGDAPRAYEGRGWSLAGTNRAAEAGTAFLKAADLFGPGADRERCLFKAGEQMMAAGRLPRARELFIEAAGGGADPALGCEARLQAAACRARIDGDPAGAVAELETLAGVATNRDVAARALLRAAELQEQASGGDEALALYERSEVASTNGLSRARARLGRGLLLYRRYRFDEAARDFEAAVTAAPGSPEAEQAFFMRGVSFYGLMRDQAALDNTHTFVLRYPDSRWRPQAEFWLGRYEYNRGRYEAAETNFVAAAAGGEAVRADDARLWAGLSAFRAKQYVRAIEHFRILTAEDPSSPRAAEARFYQGESLCEMGDYAAAILLFEDLIARFPDGAYAAAAWGRKGDCHFTLAADDPKRYAFGVEAYQKVLETAGARLDLVLQAQYKIGRSYEKMGREKEALSQYYEKVVLRFQEDRARGVWFNQAAQMWFTRAAFHAADLLEASGDPAGAESVLGRVARSGLPAAVEAEERIRRLRAGRAGGP
jgi:tetratricopeptide (TPR) repeat protein